MHSEGDIMPLRLLPVIWMAFLGFTAISRWKTLMLMASIQVWELLSGPLVVYHMVIFLTKSLHPSCVGLVPL